MSTIVDCLISEPATYFYLNGHGNLAARNPAIIEALTAAELAELKSFAGALAFILHEEGPTSLEVNPPDGQNPGGTSPSQAKTASPSAPEARAATPDPASEPARDRRSTRDPDGHQHPDIWEVVVAPRAGGGPNRIVTRRTREEVRARARREYGSCFGH